MKITQRLILSLVIVIAALLLQAMAAEAKPALEQKPEPAVARRLARPSVRVRASADRASRPSFARAVGFDPGSDVEIPETDDACNTPKVDTAERKTDAEWIGTVTVPDDIIPDLSRWELSLTPSIATGMLDGLEYLKSARALCRLSSLHGT